MLRKAATDDNYGEDDVVRGAMVLSCVCGARIPYLFDALDCPTCGRACCPDCAVLMESAWYCARCAESLLEVGNPAMVDAGRRDRRPGRARTRPSRRGLQAKVYGAELCADTCTRIQVCYSDAAREGS